MHRFIAAVAVLLALAGLFVNSADAGLTGTIATSLGDSEPLVISLDPSPNQSGTFIGIIDGITISVSVISRENEGGQSYIQDIVLFGSRSTIGSSVDLILTVEQDDFDLPDGSPLLLISSATNLAPLTSLTYDSEFEDSNGPIQAAAQVALVGTPAADDTQLLVTSDSDPFSLRSVLRITLSTDAFVGNASSRTSVEAIIPEATSLVGWGFCSILGLVMAVYRRKRSA